MNRTLSAPMPSPSLFEACRRVVVAGWRSAREAWQVAREQRRAAARRHAEWRALQRLDDHTLADIGVLRSDLPWPAQREVFARLADDRMAWHIAFGTQLPRSSWHDRI